MNSLKSFAVLLLSLGLAACSAPNDSTPTYDESMSASEALTQLLEQDWQHQLKASPEFASYLGDKRYNQQWDDMSLSAFEARHQQDVATLNALLDIDRAQLSEQDQLNYDLFKWQKQFEIERYPFQTYLVPLSQRSGVQTNDSFANYLSFKTYADYDDWLARMEKLPALIEQTQMLMRQGIAQGIVPPKATMERVPNQIAKQIVDSPEQSLYFAKFNAFPEGISEEQQQELVARAKAIIQENIVPAYQRFNDFFVNEYLPACRDSVGVSDLPNGKAYYEYLVRYFTTTDLTPEEIHQIGLQEVARNRAEMDKVIEEVGFQGTFDEFVQFLRTDPQFYYETPEALFEAYLAVSKRLDPELVHLFGKLPRMPYGVKPIPAAIAPDTTTAYYNRPAADGSRAGYYFVNLHEPSTRPKYEIEVLSVHEAVPGHHLQIALQQELGDIPDFRRYLGFTVFVEGWGLYSERLGYDMGLYKDPYSRFGQLTYDMWRAVRLVVDTGMHYKGWTRQQAIDYFKANAAKSEADIINEIDRYISNPGQALAYKIGQLKLLELREKAQTQLGDKFDIRAFHDIVLGKGAVPLNVLEAQVEQWIASQQ